MAWIFDIVTVLWGFFLYSAAFSIEVSRCEPPRPEQTPCRLTPRMSEGIIRLPWTWILLQWCSVKALSRKAVAVYTPPLLKLVICCMTYWGKDDKIPLSCLKYHRCLRHYSRDWQLQLPSQQDDRAAPTEAWVAVMILYGVMKRAYSISNLWLSFFFPSAKFVFFSVT